MNVLGWVAVELLLVPISPGASALDSRRRNGQGPERQG